MTFSVQVLKEFINERLAAAALDVCTVFEQTVVRYEAEVARQRRLLDHSCEPGRSGAGVPQQLVCKEKNAVFELHLCNQRNNLRLDQEREKPRLVKEEPEEPCISWDGQQLSVKQEPDTIMETPPRAQRAQPQLPPRKSVRELVGKRLSAAVKEIFTVLEESFGRFDEEQRLMDIFWKPQIKLHRTELSQQHICKEEEVPSEQQLERSSDVDRVEPEPPQIKEEEEEEEEELHISRGTERLVWKQEPDTFMLNPTYEERDHNTLGSDKKPLLSHNPSAAQSQDQTDYLDAASPSKRAEVNAVSPVSVNQCDTGADKNSFKCGICGKTLKSKRWLDKHYKIHRDKKCSKIHPGEQPYVCETCGESFIFSAALLSHRRSHLPPQESSCEKYFLCNLCGKGFKQLANLTVHIRTHTGEKPYVCDTCGRRFIYPTHLKSHMRVHTDVRQYSCETCGKSFKHKISLTRHMQTHTGLRQHFCETCDKGFRDSYTLSVHKRSHNNEKPYTCDTCPKRFRRSTHLQRHRRVHTGERPYSCGMCGTNFAEKESLLGHISAHKRENQFPCEPCGKSFKTNKSLLNHEGSQDDEEMSRQISSQKAPEQSEGEDWEVSIV